MTEEKKHEYIRIDKCDLLSLSNALDNPPKPKSNPKILSYNLFSKDDLFLYNETSARGNPTVFSITNMPEYNGNCSDITDAIYNHAKEHIKKHGTLKELWIEGHGERLFMGDKRQDHYFMITDFLNRIEHPIRSSSLTISNQHDQSVRLNLPHDHPPLHSSSYTEAFPKTSSQSETVKLPKIAERIIFSGCNTFEKLNERQIEYLRNFADQHNIEIVGTTSRVTDNRTRSKYQNMESKICESVIDFLDHIGLPARVLDGRFVQFTPKGEIIRDKLDNRIGDNALFEDRSWVGSHLTPTKEESQNLKLDAEAQKFWLNRGKRGNTITSGDGR